MQKFFGKYARFFALIVTLLLTLTFGATSGRPVQAVASQAEIQLGAYAEYVETFDGDMPLLFAVGHGGWKKVGDQTNGGESADPLLRDYFYRVLAVRIYQKTGHLPYIVYQQGNRNYVNTNRAYGDSEAYHPDNDTARGAYLEFHQEVDDMIARMESRYGADMALLINPHTTSLPADRGDGPWDRIAEIGFRAAVTNLSSSSNSMKALYDRKGEAALRGENSIPYQLFHAQDWPDPNTVWPAAAITNAKALASENKDVWHVLPAWVNDWDTDNWFTAVLNGATTVAYHGTNTSGHHSFWTKGLDAFQIEVNFTSESGIALDKNDPDYDPDGPGYQLDMPFTQAFMDDLIDATLYSLKTNYNWQPGGVYNVIVDNGGTGFSTTGTWEESTGQGYWATPSLYSEQDGSAATWRPTLSRPGLYEVYVRWTKDGNRTTHAQYKVSSASGSQTFTFDQSGPYDARWVKLGTFTFTAGTKGYVTLTHDDSTNKSSADAVLFRYVGRSNPLYVPVAMRPK